MLDQKEISQFNIGDEVFHFFMITKIELKTAKNNRPYLNLEFRDKSGTISAKMWDSFEELSKTAKEGSIIKVKGTVEEFMNQLQLKIEKIRLSEEDDNADISDFMPKSKRDPKVMQNELYDRIKQINNNYLNTLINNIFTDDRFEKYLRVPAGKSWHHAYIHGLIEHTLEIIKICDLICDIHPEINRDLLITGAILHDFGKTEELSFDNNFDYTDKGKLVGHIVIAAVEIEKKCAQIKNFPDDLKDQLIHLVLSHQGKLEFASPVEPKTLEAIVLYQADELSAKTNAYKNAILSEKGKEGGWTKFLPMAGSSGSSLYIPKNIKDEQKDLFNK